MLFQCLLLFSGSINVAEAILVSLVLLIFKLLVLWLLLKPSFLLTIVASKVVQVIKIVVDVVDLGYFVVFFRCSWSSCCFNYPY